MKVQPIRHWKITIEIGFIKMIVAIVLKIQQQGTRELEVQSNVSDARGGGI